MKNLTSDIARMRYRALCTSSFMYDFPPALIEKQLIDFQNGEIQFTACLLDIYKFCKKK